MENINKRDFLDRKQGLWIETYYNFNRKVNYINFEPVNYEVYYDKNYEFNYDYFYHRLF
jgi:hypothetical protein